MDKARDGHMFLLFEGVFAKTRRIIQFGNLRHTHRKDGVGGIRSLNQRGIIWGYSQRILCGDGFEVLSIRQ
jgi:hypothetical protein